MRRPLLALAALLAVPALASGATLNVNSTADTLAVDGQCTLREAIINANGNTDTTGGDCAAGSGADLINVPAGTYTLTISGDQENAGATGDLDITGDLTLRGAGAAMTALVQTASDGVLEVVAGNVVIERLRVTGPRTGLWNQGNLSVSDAIISNNPTGVFNYGDLLLRRSAVINNGTGLGQNLASADARIEDSTISGNRCAIFSVCDPFTCLDLIPIEVSNSTIAGNTGNCSGQLTVIIAGGTIRGTLLDNPGLGNCFLPMASLGHNLDSDGSCGLTDPTDLANVDPLLGPLQSNGGPTPTHALLLGSPAVDRIPTADCTYDHDSNPGTPEVALTKDQRGGMRPREGNGASPTGCDVGAYEVAACADGLDNDGDGRTDFDGGATAGITPLTSPDSNCGSALGNSEAPPPPPGCGLGPELVPAMLMLLYGVRRRAPKG